MKRFFIRGLVLLVVTGTLFAAPAEKPTPELRLKGRPSHRDLLHRRSAVDVFHENHVDTLRILAIRVEFQPDTLAETTGDGRFVLQPPAEPTIDPPPHDRTYFEAQLQALSNYYKTVSNGKLILLYEVYPREATRAYQLPHNMAYYAPGADSAHEDQRLAELFRDGFTVADRDDQIDFSRFDSFILFHAGVGRDLNFDFDPTPNDVPSAFLTFDDLHQGLAPDDPAFAGIAVQNGAVHIRDGIILPETESQEGFEIGLLGTAAIMMGFQIGLPALFNPETGASGIGRWGLMDQGSGNFQGMLPAEPSAWEKVFMGWEKPIVVTQGEQFRVAAPRETVSPNKIYKIPINSDEYFLIENRQRDVNGDGIAVGRDVNGNKVEFKDPGQILADTTIGVIVSVDEYDFGLPGSGILIWHIDESVIRAGLTLNHVNTDREHPGVDLEEADGAQDIGRFYGFLHPGSGAENGVPEDAWHRDNPINKLVNNSDVVRFGPDTMPWSRSYSGANSHIVITDFSEISRLMSFSVRNDRLSPGFPQFAGQDALAPVAAEIDPEQPGLEMLIGLKDGGVVAVAGNGLRYGSITRSVSLQAPGKETREQVQVVLFEASSGLSGPPAAVDIDGDGIDELVLITVKGKLEIYQFQKQNGQLTATQWLEFQAANENAGPLAIRRDRNAMYMGANDTVFELEFPRTINTLYKIGAPVRMLASAGPLLAVGTRDQVVIIDLSTRAVQWQQNIEGELEALAAADLDGDDKVELVTLTEDGQATVWSETGERRWQFSVDAIEPGTGLSIGDVDGDGRQDLVFAGRTQLLATSFTGSLLNGFPVTLYSEAASDTAGYHEALLLDANGKQAQSIFWLAGNGDIHGIDGRGSTFADFPFAFAASSAGQLLAADVDGDGFLELIGLSDDGFVYAYRLPDVSARYAHAWTALYGNAQRNRGNPLRLTPATGGEKLLPGNLAYNYPNPTRGNVTTIRYRLNGPARVRIKILDLAGELVDEFDGPAVPYMDNEVRWPLDNIQSGVYLARIEARGQNGTEVAVFKIAVVK
ncbi:MAG: FG-GAP-like repeat-containing protein [candidate division KSB1 bacterium]|nr:FG-GAP-like repeat-containing protein [candidate division KSB1 bacterium]